MRRITMNEKVTHIFILNFHVIFILLYHSGPNINSKAEETQETALTLAYYGGFLEVADNLIKHGADIELIADVHVQTQQQQRSHFTSLYLACLRRWSSASGRAATPQSFSSS